MNTQFRDALERIVTACGKAAATCQVGGRAMQGTLDGLATGAPKPSAEAPPEAAMLASLAGIWATALTLEQLATAFESVMTQITTNPPLLN